MEWLQKFYILVLNPIVKITNKINKKARDVIVIICCFVLCTLPYIWNTEIAYNTAPTLLIRMFEAIALIIVIVLFSFEYPIHRVEWGVLAWFWFILGALIFVMGFISKQNPGYWMSGPVVALGFPCLYLCVGNEKEKGKFITTIARSVVIISVIYFGISFFSDYFNPYSWHTGRFDGIAFDCNRVGEFCIIATAFALYLVIKKENKLFTALSSVALGFSLGFTYLSQSRTAVLAIGAMWIYAIIKGLIESNKKKTLCVVVVLAVSIALGACTVALTRAIHSNYIQKQIEASLEAQGSEAADTASGEPAVTYDDEALKTRMLQTGDGNIDSYSSGRLTIWLAYLKESKLLGNDRRVQTPLTGLWEIYNAHNNLVEITYRSGYLAGTAYLLIDIYMCLFALVHFFRKKEDNEKTMSALITIGFFAFSNLMPAYNPITTAVFLFYMLAQTPMFEKGAIFNAKANESTN